MQDYRQIRAIHDRHTVVVFQAFCPQIADAALAAGRFVAPFSFNRMTWIKPSFLWLMERSGWATKPNQERILAVRITRAGFEAALSQAVLTTPEPGADAQAWGRALKASPVRVQWDPERALRGGKLQHRAIQIGLRGEALRAYVEDWTVGIEDWTARARRIRALRDQGDHARARRLLTPEPVLPVEEALRRRLRMSA